MAPFIKPSTARKLTPFLSLQRGPLLSKDNFLDRNLYRHTPHECILLFNIKGHSFRTLHSQKSQPFKITQVTMENEF